MNTQPNQALENALGHIANIRDLIEEYNEDFDDAVYEDLMGIPLDVEFRSGWRSPARGDLVMLDPEEMRIILTCGGPGLQILCELGNLQECRVQYRDWGTPFQDCEMSEEDQAAVAQFAGMFTDN